MILARLAIQTLNWNSLRHIRHGMLSQDSNVEIIHTKLNRPPVPHDLVAREQLLDRLNSRLNRPMSLICAPAGYGKSTLVSEWLEHCSLPFAWLSLNETENDLRLFLSYFLAAVKTILPGIGAEILSLLKGQKLPPTTLLAGRLTNELNSIHTPFILVLDDYHLIDNNAVHELLSEIVKYPPRAMHLVLVSRIDPPLPLTTLRAKGQMTEIRVADLRFSREETAQFLQQMLATTLDEATFSLLEEKSEGWITGLRLAALSLRHTDNMKNIIAGLPEANRFVLDYFVAEILSQQPAMMQKYLLATSVLSRFCEPLCDNLFDLLITPNTVGEENISGREFIDQLKQTNLFVIYLDEEGTWFRYHHLFKNLLQQKARDHFTPTDLNRIHAKVSTWFAEFGYFEEAIQHALEGGDLDQAVEIVGRARYDISNKDQWHRLERWLNLFTAEAVQHYPHLILLRCWLDYYLWYRLDSLVKDLDQADLLLNSSTLESSEVEPMKAEVGVIRSNLAYWILKPAHGVKLANQALHDSLETHECTKTTAVFGIGPLHQMLGEAQKGESIVRDHLEQGRYHHPSSQARVMLSLCILYWPEAETRKLQQAASRLLELSLEHDLLWNHSFARYFLGLSYYERNELEEAVKQLQVVVGKPYRFPIQNVVHCSYLLSLCYQALGLPEQAREVAKSVAKLTFERRNEMFIDLSEAFQAELDLLQGRSPQAIKWARAFVPPPPHGMQRYFNAEITAIRILLAINTPESLESAAEQLDSMKRLLDQVHHRRLLIDIHAMQALLAASLDQEATALERLSEALGLAEPERFIRPFLDLGQNMGSLLRRIVKQSPGNMYAQQILVAFGTEHNGAGQSSTETLKTDQSVLINQALVDPLTKREIEILSLLLTRLSNPEIAEKLFISTETVKRHLYNIYQKFGVANRNQAIARAKSLGMI